MNERFSHRHIGPGPEDAEAMLRTVGASSMEELVGDAVPASIRLERALDLPPPRGEAEVLDALRTHASRNRVCRSYLGMGYHDTITPPVILRNVLENPAWYTAYTPYQAEISQGRLEALLLFQTMVQDLTAMPVSNASLLDEATAAAEAMTMAQRCVRGRRNTFLVAEDCHPQTISVVQTRAAPLGIRVRVVNKEHMPLDDEDVFGVLAQYPTTAGEVWDPRALIARAHDGGALVTLAVDLLAMTMLEAPGTMGADIVVGTSQRFGVPMGFGGPHAAFLATTDKHVRKMPGRVIGLSKDRDGAPALRMALQTREQHIRRERATSNVCTAQVLLAVVSAMYAVYHGPEGLLRIARGVHDRTRRLAEGLASAGLELRHARYFDTLVVEAGDRAEAFLGVARERGINLRLLAGGGVAISFDETVTDQDIVELWKVFEVEAEPSAPGVPLSFGALERTTPYLEHPTFHAYHSETEMLRYLYRLETRDLSLTTAMIPLGSCTMKLNATTEMLPITWPELGRIHPFAPVEQTSGYRALIGELEEWLAEITGFHATSMQPNAGSQGEYAGLLVIRAYHADRGESHRDVCLIPTSAHGTNPASAVMAGMRVVAVGCDSQGNIDVEDLRAKAETHGDALAALMVTYPSTHGVFEEAIVEICDIVHDAGGQVYMDGANLNAMVGLCRPGDFGPDVCHLNLHKTFCIPHGGGGPGMGPICVAEHLAPFLPGHPVIGVGGERGIGPVSAAPFGSPSILPISWAYIALMGAEGLKQASEMAVLGANYIAARLSGHYEVLFRGARGRVAHECIVDCRSFKAEAGITVDDIAKRLMDYGFHAPTMSWPVAGTLMIEPTESESRQEIDRFCDAMIAIRKEVRAVAEGVYPRDDNPLRNAPHTAVQVCSDTWEHAYGRELAAYPTPDQLRHKYWPYVGRVDNVYGDKHMCTCLPMSEDDGPQ